VAGAVRGHREIIQVEKGGSRIEEVGRGLRTPPSIPSTDGATYLIAYTHPHTVYNTMNTMYTMYIYSHDTFTSVNFSSPISSVAHCTASVMQAM
jgi:hypothetical protein